MYKKRNERGMNKNGNRALRFGEFAREIIAEVHGGNVAATTKMEVVAAHVSLLAAAYRNLANYPNEARASASVS